MDQQETFELKASRPLDDGLETSGRAAETLWSWINYSIQNPGQDLQIPKALLSRDLDLLDQSCKIEIDGETVRISSHPLPGRHTKKMVSIVVPIYFEELLIDELVQRLQAATVAFSDRYDYELIFVNDGSTDGSLELLKKHYDRDPEHIRIINLSRNFGHQLAISAGFEYARGDAVVVMDGDLQDPPEAIARMLVEWENGYHVVYGIRQQRQGETIFKLATAKLFYRLLSRLSEIELPVDAGDFRLMDRQVVDQLRKLPEKSRYIRGLVNWVGFTQKGILYERDKRYAGETKYTLRKMIRFALDGITGFSEKPLNIAGYLGALFSLIAFLGIVWVLGSYLLGREHLVTGWASTMAAIFSIGAIQLLALSVVGQYVGRIYKETRDRPLYIVQDVIENSRQKGTSKVALS